MAKRDKEQVYKRRAGELHEALAVGETEGKRSAAKSKKPYGIEWTYQSIVWPDSPFVMKTWYATERAREQGIAAGLRPGFMQAISHRLLER